MVRHRKLAGLNVFLSVLLLASIATVIEPGITGSFHEEKPSCTVTGDGNSSISVDRCCLYASQKLSCEETDKGLECGSGQITYSLNQEAVDYCRSKGAELE